jgi:dCTP deaminase
MSLLPAQLIRKRAIEDRMIEPFCERGVAFGMSYGLSSNGYDMRLMGGVVVPAKNRVLGSTIERFILPNDLAARIHDKSTWIRNGVRLGNTIAEAGWCGYLTVEIFNDTDDQIEISAGTPIAQIVFETLVAPTEQPYRGKYFDQPPEPVHAIYEAER